MIRGAAGKFGWKGFKYHQHSTESDIDKTKKKLKGEPLFEITRITSTTAQAAVASKKKKDFHVPFRFYFRNTKSCREEDASLGRDRKAAPGWLFKRFGFSQIGQVKHT